MKAKLSIVTIALLVTPMIFAHSGHDHEAWTSGLIHSIAVLGFIAGIVVAYKMLKWNKKPRTQKVKK